ncbi:hypothetical protein GCM10023186_03680 [Hymenobacter koreensis]|uniref:Uncharacterized protein n=2 Tax=Hymenobacter koreensis TaxID=1084523 RepID=A0ABP8IU80_9BACT
MEDGRLMTRSGTAWKLEATIGFVNNVYDVCACNTSLYVTAENHSTYENAQDKTLGGPVTFLMRVANGQVRNIRLLPGKNYMRCDAAGRLWLFGSEGIWELQTPSLLRKRF